MGLQYLGLSTAGIVVNANKPIVDLVQHDKTLLFTARFHATRSSVMVVLKCKPGSLTLDLFKLLEVLLEIGS